MATTYQPLLVSQKRSMLSCNTFYIVISLFAKIFSACLLLPNLTKTSHFNLSTPSYICNKARNLDTCLKMISKVVSDEVIPSNGVTLLQKSMLTYIKQMERVVKSVNSVKNKINDYKEEVALADCLELIDLSIDQVTDSIAALANRTVMSDTDAHAWLSSVLTNHVTCLDGLHVLGKQIFEKQVKDLISRAEVYLAVFVVVTASNDEMAQPLKGNLPSWVTLMDRRLLESEAKDIQANVVVAKDGSGNYTTVTDAIASAPNNTESRYVIYVKKGTYKEYVQVGKEKKNLMIIGDGMASTIITGSKFNDNNETTTFNSATLAAVGDWFILQDICVKNTAGPENYQAVALRVGADQSVINRCLIDAYQDTLYPHSLRQFYRDCNITGTIDFIFGNAAVVLQNCKIIPRKPMEEQKNMVTAQGRTDPNQNTGTSIQNCDIIASSDLAAVQGSFKTYLGRPWQNFSRTVVMQSYIGDLVDPAGWSEWDGDLNLNTLYYGEYMNRGPGAGTSKRVKWPTVHVNMSESEAVKFTVGELIQGGEWLESTGVAFIEGFYELKL